MPLATVGLILILPPGISTFVDYKFGLHTLYNAGSGFQFLTKYLFFLTPNHNWDRIASLSDLWVECSSYPSTRGSLSWGSSFSLGFQLPPRPTSTETQGHLSLYK